MLHVVAKIVFAVSSLHVARTIIYYPCIVAIQYYLCHVLSGLELSMPHAEMMVTLRATHETLAIL